MKSLDFNKVITHDEFLNISEKEKEFLISIADIEINKNKEKNPVFVTLGLGKTQARLIINNSFYNKFSLIQKEFIAVTIAYESEEIIKLLLKYDILYEHLEGLFNNISSLKKLYKNNPNILKSGHYQTILSILDKVYLTIKFITKSEDEYLIINKLSYIVAFEKDLYLKLQQDKIKRPQ